MTVINDDARERLLKAATKLFVERGYAAASVREIVEGANVTKPSLYYHFKSKEGIYLEIMSRIQTLFDEKVEKLSSLEGTLEERLYLFLWGLVESAQMNLDTVRLAYSIYFGPPQGAPYIDFEVYMDKVIDLVTSMLEEGINLGEIEPCDITCASFGIVAIYNFIMEELLCRTSPRVGSELLKNTISMHITRKGKR